MLSKSNRLFASSSRQLDAHTRDDKIV